MGFIYYKIGFGGNINGFCLPFGAAKYQKICYNWHMAKNILKKLPKPNAASNKYSRGFVLVAGGGLECTGASRLAAMAALRTGAGIVKIACPPKALVVYARQLLAVMVAPVAKVADFAKLIADKRVGAVLIGPGNGVSKRTHDFALAALAAHKNVVLDADAITVFKGKTAALFAAIKKCKGQVVLTPHDGEFERLFKLGPDRQKSVLAAAKQSGAVVLLKGNNTIIASPSGKLAVNKNAPATLATAGSGDVLAGIITSLMAQKMSAFDAAVLGAYIHAEAAKLFGSGLISEDLPDLIADVLKQKSRPV
jgi:hydroxyethylthiazole kinase-like uncharacterized protein yjeF